MPTKFETFIKSQLKTNLPDIRPGDTVRVYQKIPALAIASAGKKEEDKERVQTFEGLVIAKKHGKEMGATITVRKVISGVGVERIFPIHSPTLQKIEVLKKGRAKRAKLYYLREAKGKRARLKKKSTVPTQEFTEAVAKEKPEEMTGEVKEVRAEEVKKEK